MVMPKITEKDFGKKMTLKGWVQDGMDEWWFIPFGFSPIEKDVVFGKDHNDRCCEWINTSNFFPYEEFKRKITKRMAPAIKRNSDTFWLTQVLYESEEKAKADCGDNFLEWPASESLCVEIEVEE